MTIGLTAKYNWNTFHKYAPSTVFNMFDVRPELRYYFRTKKRPVYRHRTDRYIVMAATDDRGKIDSVALNKYREDWQSHLQSIEDRSFSEWFKENIWTVERKNPKPQRAQWIGAYVDYGSFAFKFGQKGIQGHAVGLGASYGWGMPLYEYDKGAVDIEFGFSVGLQVARYDVFTHNPDSYYYTKIVPESKKFHMTPFPVISELRVAFAWRPVSIKEKYIKDDPQKLQYNKVLKDLNTYFKDIKGQFDKSLDDMKRVWYEKNDSIYRSDFVSYVEDTRDGFKKNNVDYDPILNDKNKEKLKNMADARYRQALKEFDKAVGKAEAAEKKAAEPQKEVEMAGKVKKTRAESENGEDTAVKPEKVKKEKPVKEKKEKKQKAVEKEDNEE